MLRSFRIARCTSLLQAIRRQSAASARTLAASARTLAPVPGLDLSETKLRRAIFYVPCSEERKIQKSLHSPADCIMYDLEDGVSLNRKSLARSLVTGALSGPQTRELGVRINSIGSGLEADDLAAILRCARLDVIMVPKVETPGDIRYVASLVDKLAPESKVKIIAGIETALGVVNVRDIALADKRVDALLFAAEDYCADTGITRTKGRQELYFARSVVATTARAYKLQAIDMVTMDFRDMDVLREESREGAEMGFTGKQVIHPAQVDIVQECFAPSSETVAKAWRIVDGYQRHYKLGKGAFDLDGKAIDMPVVKWAYRVLHRAELAGVDGTKIGE